jgi:hypothetical protein
VKEGNSFSNILLMMKNQGYNKDNDITIGAVKSILPLQIEIGNFILEEEDFFIVEGLKDSTREIELSVLEVVGLTTSASSHVHSLQPFEIAKATMTIKSPLIVGDAVLVLIQDSDFYIIDKVVVSQ